MKQEGKIDYQVVDDCFNELSKVLRSFLHENYEEEAFTASVFFISTNILTWAKLYNLNVEQFMQHTFDEISNVTARMEKKDASD